MELVPRACLLLLLVAASATSPQPPQEEEDLTDATPCPEALSEEVDNAILLANGSLLASNGLVFPPGEFWLDGPRYRACVCHQRPCIKKCCPHGHHYRDGDSSGVCTPAPKETTIVDKYPDHYILVGVTCSDKFRIEKEENFSITANGTLHVTTKTSTMVSAPGDYCIEVFTTNSSEDIIPFPCFPEVDEEEDDISQAVFLIYPVGMIVSLPFLLATFLVYALIPELRNLHGKCLMSHTTTLFVAYLFLAIVQLASSTISEKFCVGAAFIVHFSFLASFFWLNIMCFDMWWTFSGMQRMRGSSKRVEHKKFIIYSAYAWGCPFAMLVVCLVMQFVADPVKYITPMFGHGKCWFGDDEAIFVYFYGPVAVLILANIIMFVTTALKILKLKRETAMLKHSDSRRHDEDGNNKERFSLYLKLFVVMGINWAMEVLSWAMGGPEYLWYFTDLGNTLQGVLIFFIFVWKKKIKRLLVRRFGKSSAANGHSKTSTRISTTRASTRATSLNSSTCFTDTANTYPLVHTNSVVA